MEIEHRHFDSIDSTNTWMHSHKDLFSPHKILVISADEQTAGKGRYLRTWISPAKLNIYLSFAFCISPLEQNPGPLTQVLAISTIHHLRSLGFDITFKWPNDLVFKGKKLGGILCELIDLEQYTAVILGIGLNVNMNEEDLKNIDSPASSLLSIRQKEVDLSLLRSALVSTFVISLESYFKQGFVPFHEAIHEVDSMKGKNIQFHTGKKLWKGKYHSHNLDGSITLESTEGELKTFFSGDLF